VEFLKRFTAKGAKSAKEEKRFTTEDTGDTEGGGDVYSGRSLTAVRFPLSAVSC